MKIYEILDYEDHLSVGFLLYYEKKKEFVIELHSYLDEWTAPMLFSNLVKHGVYTVPRDLSLLWVKERIIPNDRQNISEILKTHKLQSYDEMTFLELSKGKCSQDSLYIRKAAELPASIIKRRKQILDCSPLDHNKILCFFENDICKLVDLKNLLHIKDVNKILSNDALYRSCMVGTGGCFITFNDSIDIPTDALYEAGTTLPLSLRDILAFATNNLLDTSDSCKLLNCTRQNVSYLTKRCQLTPAKENVNGNIYLKGDVLRNSW